MAKNKVQVEEQEFHTKEFKAYFSFDVKEEGMKDENGNEILKIKGWANFAGNTEDENSVFVDHTGDVILPSAFDLSVWKSNPQILWQHDRDYTIGKGLKAIKKAEGLEIEAEIHKNAMEEEDWYRIKNGLVTKFSVGFRTMAGEWREIKKTPVFYITKALLFEVSVVGIPANSESSFVLTKGLSDGTISFGDIQEKEIQPTQQPAVTNKEIGDDKMKMKLRDLLAEDKVKELEALGLTEKLEEETDVDVKAFVEAKIKQELVIFKEALLAELKAEVETEVKEEVPATPSTETEVTTEEKEKEAEEVKEEDEVDEAQLKAISEAVEKLKALI